MATQRGPNAGRVFRTIALLMPGTMDEIVALCRRRGFIFQSSEIYGGINGFWDYGPMGTELKRNLKNAWWQDVVQRELLGPDGNPVDIVGVDCTIIMNPKVWEASGHLGGFGLDTPYDEPGAADDPMLAYPNVTITPHTAAQPRTNALKDLGEMMIGMAGLLGHAKVR
jgi:hypothetical protein